MKPLESRNDQVYQRHAIAQQLARGRVANSPLATSVQPFQLDSLVNTLSTEALNADTRSESPSQRPEQITSALSNFLMSIDLELPTPAKQPKRQSVVKRKVEWMPGAKTGEVKEGLSAMGHLRVLDEVNEREIPQESSSASSSLGISVQSSTGSAGRIQVSFAQQSQSSAPAAKKPRIEGGECLPKLMKNGLVADGLASLINGGFQSGSGNQARELIVRTNATGKQRVLSIKSTGLLDKNTSVLGAFQIVENKPIIKKATDSLGIKESRAKPPAHIFKGFSGQAF